MEEGLITLMYHHVRSIIFVGVQIFVLEISVPILAFVTFNPTVFVS